MDGLSVFDMAQRLNTSTAAVKMRLSRKGIEPYRYIGTAGIYTENDFEAIKETNKRGPKRKKPESNKTAKKTPKQK